MARFKGVVLYRYYQEIEVEADTREDAERIMCDEFQLEKAEGDCDVYDLTEVKDE
jgi:hypothetical protein